MKKAILIVSLLMLLLSPSRARAAKSYQLDIAPLFQEDYADPLFEWKGVPKSVATSGCGAVCVSMVESYLTPEKAKAPEELLLWAYENGRYVGNGLRKNTLVEMLADCGIKARYCTLDAKGLRSALRKNCPVIVYVEAGYFTNGGHYMVICGIDRKDRLTIIDPNSREKTEKTYDMQWISAQAQDGRGYIVCERLETGPQKP